MSDRRTLWKGDNTAAAVAVADGIRPVPVNGGNRHPIWVRRRWPA